MVTVDTGLVELIDSMALVVTVTRQQNPLITATPNTLLVLLLEPIL